MTTSTNSEKEQYTMKNEALIELKDVHLKFRSHVRRSFKETLIGKLTGKKMEMGKPFWLYQGLNLKIEHGERVAIIGHNGAGKTTLLKTICGIYRPTKGEVKVSGSLAALMDLGGDINPTLSAADNIIISGVMMGRTPEEMQAKIPAIIEFAGLEEFFELPVKYYSSGMRRRLAFAVGTEINCDILLNDEVFAGGDIKFIEKATKRIKSVIDQAHICVFVSHSLPLIEELTDRTIWMGQGRIVDDGPTVEIVSKYQEFMKSREAKNKE